MPDNFIPKNQMRLFTWHRPWPNGHIKGIKARGGYVVDVEWRNGKLTHAVIRSKATGTCPVRYADKQIEIETKAGGIYLLDGNLRVTTK